MKLQRTFICIAGVFFAVGFAASQAAAGGDDLDGCSAGDALMEIEVNALRAGGKTVVTSPNDTTKVTAKARILKGTAPPGTTIDTTLRIEAFDGEDSISASEVPIQLEIGKGGTGKKLPLNIPKCDAGSIDFVATFFGTAVNGVLCATRRITKTCK